MVSSDDACRRCSDHPTSSELRESRWVAELILSEAIRPRRVSCKRVGEDERDDFDLLLTELVEYRRVRRPLWDICVTNSESVVPRSNHRDGIVTGVPINQNIPTTALIPSPPLCLIVGRIYRSPRVKDYPLPHQSACTPLSYYDPEECLSSLCVTEYSQAVAEETFSHPVPFQCRLRYDAAVGRMYTSHPSNTVMGGAGRRMFACRRPLKRRVIRT